MLKVIVGILSAMVFVQHVGGRLFLKAAVMPDVIGIMAGGLDDPTRFQPTMDIYTASAQPWDCMNPDLPMFPKMPPV